MTVREIHAEIAGRSLFTFKASDPVSVVSKALRSRCSGSKNKATQEIWFAKVSPGTYVLADKAGTP